MTKTLVNIWSFSFIVQWKSWIGECCIPKLFCCSFEEQICPIVPQTTSPIISSSEGYFAFVNVLVYSQEQQTHAGCPTVPPRGPFGALLLFNVATAVCGASIFQTQLTRRSYWYHVAGGIYGDECKCSTPLLLLRKQFEQYSLFKISSSVSPKQKNTQIFSAHTHTKEKKKKKKSTYTVLWELCKIEEKRRKRKAIQITQRLNYQTRFVPLRAVQERAISIPKAGSHERGPMK